MATRVAAKSGVTGELRVNGVNIYENRKFFRLLSGYVMQVYETSRFVRLGT